MRARFTRSGAVNLANLASLCSHVWYPTRRNQSQFRHQGMLYVDFYICRSPPALIIIVILIAYERSGGSHQWKHQKIGFCALIMTGGLILSSLSSNSPSSHYDDKLPDFYHHHVLHHCSTKLCPYCPNQHRLHLKAMNIDAIYNIYILISTSSSLIEASV